MPQYIDLHMHTNRSDGILFPVELLEVVRTKELAAFSVTDHDSIEGYRGILPLLIDGDPELVTGVELSAFTERGDMHLLAYLFDPDSEALVSALELFITERNHRGLRMVEKLNEEGLELSFEAVEKAAGGGAVGRPHIAEAMIAQGIVDSFGMAFRKYIGNHCTAYVPKSKMTPAQAIDLIHRAGGVAVLAHPFINDMHKYLDELVGLGLDGMEVFHYSHSRQKTKDLQRMAQERGLLISGGSDFHGRQEHEGEIGADSILIEHLDRLKERAQENASR